MTDVVYLNNKLNDALQAAYKQHAASPTAVNEGIIIGVARAVDIVREFILDGCKQKP